MKRIKKSIHKILSSTAVRVCVFVALLSTLPVRMAAQNPEDQTLRGDDSVAMFARIRALSKAMFAPEVIFENRWHTSLGFSARTGMKLSGVEGGAFDVPARSTGFVGNTEYDINISNGEKLTQDWRVDNNAQIDIHFPGGAPGGEDWWGLSYEKASRNDEGTFSGAGVEGTISYDVFQHDYGRIGIRLSLAGYFGMRADATATRTEYKHRFDETAINPFHPDATVEINPYEVTPLAASKIAIKGGLYQIGVGPEFLLGEEDSWIRLTVNPALLVNVSSLKVTASDGVGGAVVKTSDSLSDVHIGIGISAAAEMDISEGWAMALSLGYDYVPKFSVGSDISADIDLSAVTFGARLIYSF